MQFGWQYVQKPPMGTRLDREHPLANGLVWYAPLLENGGTIINDLIGGVNLTPAGTPTWSPGVSPVSGGGPVFATSTSYFSAPIPRSLQIQAPITLVLGYKRTGNASSAACPIFGLLVNSTAGAPYGSAVLFQNTTTSIELGAASGSSSNLPTPAFNPTTGVFYTIVIVFGVTAYTVYAFPATGAPITPLTATWGTGTIGGATYSASATIGLGSAPGWSRYPNGSVYFAGIYNRALSANEAAAWGVNPWAIMAPYRGVAELVAAATPTPTPTPTSTTTVWAAPQLVWSAPQRNWSAPQRIRNA